MTIVEHKALFDVVRPFLEEKIFIQNMVSIFRRKYLGLEKIQREIRDRFNAREGKREVLEIYWDKLYQRFVKARVRSKELQ